MTRWFGHLYVHVVEGEKLVHSYAAFRRRLTHASCYRKAVCGADIYKCGGADPCGGKPDPYCTVFIETFNGAQVPIGKTLSVSGTEKPVWKHEFSSLIDVSDSDQVFTKEFCADPQTGPKLTVTVHDDDGGGNYMYSDDVLGSATVPLAEVALEGKSKRVQLTLRHPQTKDTHVSLAQITLEFKWFPFIDPDQGLPLGEGNVVPHSYFKRAKGNHVILYQDAHVHEHETTPLPMGGPLDGQHVTSRGCWEDISRDIEQAKYFVYICGW